MKTNKTIKLILCVQNIHQKIIFLSLYKRGINYSPFIFKGRYVVNIIRGDGGVEN